MLWQKYLFKTGQTGIRAHFSNGGISLWLDLPDVINIAWDGDSFDGMDFEVNIQLCR